MGPESLLRRRSAALPLSEADSQSGAAMQALTREERDGNRSNRARPRSSDRAARTCRPWRGGTSGCISRRWAATATSAEIPIIVRGEGCYVYDEHGRRYLDGLAALFCVNSGHGRAELADAASAQIARARLLHELELRASARDRARRARSRRSRPAGLERVFFTSGGSEAVESAWKLARAYHRHNGFEQRTKIIARELAYHGTSLGALAATGLDGAEDAVRAARPRRLPRRRTRTPTARRRASTRSGWPTRSSSGSSSRAPRRSPP